MMFLPLSDLVDTIDRLVLHGNRRRQVINNFSTATTTTTTTMTPSVQSHAPHRRPSDLSRTQLLTIVRGGVASACLSKTTHDHIGALYYY